MKLTCKVMDLGLTQPCGQPAVMAIMVEQAQNVLEAWPVCEDHAAEEAHEARASMSEDEFTLVPLPKPRPEVERGPHIRGMTTEERRHVRLSLMDLGFERTSPTFLGMGSESRFRDRGDGQYAEQWAYGRNCITLTWAPKATDENGDPL